MVESTDGDRHLYDLEARDLAVVGRALRQHFDPDVWRNEPAATRAQRAQAVHAYIRHSYGLEPRDVCFHEGWPDYLLGDFSADTGEVRINADLLARDDPYPLLETLAHENRHAVQQQRMDGRLEIPYLDRVGTREVDIWIEATRRYGDSDYMAYHYNPLELDAREASEAVVKDGFRREHERLLEERLAELQRG
jgi:hypothetical protein